MESLKPAAPTAWLAVIREEGGPQLSDLSGNWSISFALFHCRQRATDEIWTWNKEAKKRCDLFIFFQGEGRWQSCWTLELCACLHTLHTLWHSSDWGLNQFGRSINTSSIWPRMWPRIFHGAVVGGCDSKGAGEKGINVKNESLRAVYSAQAVEDDIWDLQCVGTLVLQSTPALEAF